MPKELKKRGRREAKKRKLEQEDTELDHSQDAATSTSMGAATSVTTTLNLAQAIGRQDFVSSTTEKNDVSGGAIGNYDRQTFMGVSGSGGFEENAGFYGLLDDQEAEYFRKADEMLEANAFSDVEERNIFVANVYREAEGKELKLSNSQGCSRLMERLILLSSPSQLKSLFQKFSGHFVHLITHRFASHCCETLFTRAAPVVTIEMDPLAPQDINENEVFVSTENLFLYALAEIEPQLDELLMDRFASHVLRTLFAILGGLPLENSTLRASKNKESISLPSTMVDLPKKDATRREVPPSFHEAISRIMERTVKAVDLETLRKLAIDPIGSPMLQLFVEIDMSRSRKYRSKTQDSLVGKLMLATEEEEERIKESRESFVKSLLFDTIGSHLVETIVRTAPKKTYEEIYMTYFKGKLGTLCHHEMAMFVVQRVLEKAGPEILKDCIKEIAKEMVQLIEESKVAIIKTLLTSCKTHNIDVAILGNALKSAYKDQPTDEILLNMLKIQKSELEAEEPAEPVVGHKKKKDPSQLHGSLLAQSILEFPDSISGFLQDSILAQSQPNLIKLAKHQIASHVFEKSLTSPFATAPYKRKLLNMLFGSLVTLALHPAGSHVVDACAVATMSGGGMNNYRQRVAEELAASEAQLRDSFFGRAVWRNWKMDLWKTRRADWMNLSKQQQDGEDGGVVEGNTHSVQEFGGQKKMKNGGGKGEQMGDKGVAAGDAGAGKKKSALQLAAERHAAKKAKLDQGPLSGANTAMKRKRDVVATT